MTTQIQRRRGTTSEHSTFTGAVGEITVDTTKDTVVVHDGSTIGGHPLAKENNPTFTGNVGIGTIDPKSLLHLSGAPYITLSNTSAGTDLKNWMFSGGSDGKLRIRTGTDAFVYTSAMAVDHSGNVGIGTDSPAGFLDIAGTSGTYPTQQIRHSVADTEGEVLRIARTDIPAIRYHSITARHGGGAVVGNNSIQFKIHNPAVSTTAQNTVLHLDGSGNVGIGTTSPDGKLGIQVDTGKDITAGLTTGSPMFTYRNGSGAWFHVGKHPTDDALIFSNGATTTTSEMARFDNVGRLLVGTSASVTTVSDTPKNQIFVGDQGAASFIRGSANEFGSNVHLVKSRNTLSGSRTILQSGDEFGTIWFAGDDGSTLNSVGALIRAQVDGTPGTNDMPGRLVFSTTSDGASSPTERLRIDSSGNVGIGTTSPEASLTISPGNSAATSIGGRSINYGANAIVTSGRTGYLVRVSNNFTTSGDNSGFQWIYPFDTGGNNDYKVFRSAAGATLVDKFWVNQAGGAYFASSVGIGTASPLGKVHVESAATTAGWQIRTDSVGLNNESGFYRDANDNYEVVIRNGNGGLSYIKNDGGASTANLTFNVQGSERMRIDSSGRLLVGTSSALSSTGYNSNLQIQASSAGSAAISVINTSDNAFSGGLVNYKSRGSSAVQANDGLAQFRFTGYDGAAYIEAARVAAEVDGTPGTNDMPGRLVFSTTADGASSPTERMRITSNVDNLCLLGQLTNPATSTLCITVRTGSANGVNAQITSNTGTSYPWSNYNASGTYVGGIACTSTGTTFPSVSDYRLKENIQPLVGAINLVSQLKPSTFEFKENLGETVQGFIAHEVQEVIPLAVVGEKDAEDANGNLIYQGVDASKLVPLLTAALQEALAKIDDLEARLTAAGL